MIRSYLFRDLKLKQEAIFDLDELYKTLFRWFELNQYNFYEREYADIDEPKGKHLEIYWTADKVADQYVKYVIEVNFLILGMQKVDIEKQGLKLSQNKATIELRITAYLEKDYDGKWSKTPLHQGIRKIYDKTIVRKRLNDQQTQLFIESHKLIDEIKAYLALHKI